MHLGGIVSGLVLVTISDIIVCQDWLVIGWVNVCRQVYHCGV